MSVTAGVCYMPVHSIAYPRGANEFHENKNTRGSIPFCKCVYTYARWYVLHVSFRVRIVAISLIVVDICAIIVFCLVSVAFCCVSVVFCRVSVVFCHVVVVFCNIFTVRNCPKKILQKPHVGIQIDDIEPGVRQFKKRLVQLCERTKGVENSDAISRSYIVRQLGKKRISKK